MILCVKVQNVCVDTGDGHREERHFRVTDPAEYAAEYVVGDNEGGARGADLDVGGRLSERFLRHLIQLCTCGYKPSDELQDSIAGKYRIVNLATFLIFMSVHFLRM